jgi:phage shock protein C
VTPIVDSLGTLDDARRHAPLHAGDAGGKIVTTPRPGPSTGDGWGTRPRGNPMVLATVGRDDRIDRTRTPTGTAPVVTKGTPVMARRDQHLHRDTDDRKIAGVCSGLARYFDVDPLLVRVAFVAGIVISGVSLIAYPLLWWLVDPAPAGHWAPTAGTDATMPPPSTTTPPTTPNPDEHPGQQAA